MPITSLGGAQFLFPNKTNTIHLKQNDETEQLISGEISPFYLGGAGTGCVPARSSLYAGGPCKQDTKHAFDHSNCTRVSRFQHGARAQDTGGAPSPDIRRWEACACVFTSLGSADLSQLRGSLRLRRGEKGACVLQSAAKGHLADLAVRTVAAHLALVVWQHLGHRGGRASLAQGNLVEKTRRSERVSVCVSAAGPPRCSGDAPAVWRLSRSVGLLVSVCERSGAVYPLPCSCGVSSACDAAAGRQRRT